MYSIENNFDKILIIQ